jgi:hypothetical protein
MKRAAAILGRVRRRDGQVIPLVAVSMVVLIGMAALVFDIGRVYVAQQQLQAAVNSAALAAGQDLPSATAAHGAAVSYSGAPGDYNAVGGYEVGAGPANVTFECVPNAPEYNSGSCPADTSSPATYCPNGCNAVSVTEKATVQTTLGGVLSLPSFTVSASATAAQRGDVGSPVNAYVILDNTRSMGYTAPTKADPEGGDCAATVPGITVDTTNQEPDKLDCAKYGALALLNTLDPCDPSLPTGCPTAAMTKNSTATPPTELGANMTPTSSAYDEVGLLVIPALNVAPKSPATFSGELAEEINCTAGSTFADEYPPWQDPTTAGILSSDAYVGYQAVGLSSDYRLQDASADTTASTSTSSNIVEALYWGTCTPATYPAGTGNNPNAYGLKDVGGVGSYLAGAISDAQYELQQNARAGATNVIVIESDGELNPTTTFSDGSTSTTACTDAYNAAAEAKAAGDTIYTIEYDSDGTCGDGSGAWGDADTLMTGMASSTSDAHEVNGAGDLTAPFQAVGDSIGSGAKSTLIPVCTQAPPACD